MKKLFTDFNRAQTQAKPSGILVLAVCLSSVLCCALALSASYVLPESAYTAVSASHFSMTAKKEKSKHGGESSDSGNSTDCGSCGACEDCGACDSCVESACSSGCDSLLSGCTL